MKKRISVVFAVAFLITFSAYANEKWSVQKTAGALSACYQSVSTMYCAGSMNKKVTETDLKHYLSVYLYFAKDDAKKADLVVQPGIMRLIKGSRSEQGDRILKGAYDYLLREGKSKSIMLSAGVDKSGQSVMSEAEQIIEIESVNWPKYIDSTIDTISCTSDQKVNLTFKVTNSLKKDFLLKGEEVELRIMSGRHEILSVGSVKDGNSVIKAGETALFQVDIPVTGDMLPSMRYRIIPFIRNIQVSKEDFSVLCEK
ncbi:MAG TPA: hypothetical protein VLJ60_05385 [bacterium]|nr:hypothetical protein [bacterium]